MKRVFLAFLLAAALAGTQAAAQSPAPAELQKQVADFVRRLYALGPAYTVTAAAPTDAPVPGFYQVAVEVGFRGDRDTLVVYVSRDGRHMLRGELFDLAVDPFAATREKITLDGAPSKGPADARVVVVEYSDFQCPHCRLLHQAVQNLVPRYPQVRFVFKDFPLAQIHPWAMTAAIAGRCAYRQDPQAFWPLHDAIFEAQERITAAGAWDTLLGLAAGAGLDAAAIRACLSDPAPKAEVEASVREGQDLRIANTPTVFVNGRRVVGGEPALLQQFIEYELAAAGAARPQPGTPRAQPGTPRPRPPRR